MSKSYRDTGTPAFEPVSIDEVVAWTAAEATDQDLLAILVEAGVDHIEGELETRLAARTGTFRFDGFADELVLDVAPVSAIASVTYLDSARVRQTLDPALYAAALEQFTPVIRPLAGWPSHSVEPGSVVVTATVGYAEGKVPAALKQAVAVWVADRFLNREGKTEGDAAVERLVRRFRRGSF